jgi:glycosyltransferase involved in cell wall biosynthesis
MKHFVDRTFSASSPYITGIPRVSNKISEYMESVGVESILWDGSKYKKMKISDLSKNKSITDTIRRIPFVDFCASLIVNLSPSLKKTVQRLIQYSNNVKSEADFLKIDDEVTIYLLEIPDEVRANYLCSLAEAGTKIRFLIYDVIPYTHESYFLRNAILKQSKFSQLVILSDIIFCNSQHVKNEIIRIFPQCDSRKIKVFELPSSFQIPKNQDITLRRFLKNEILMVGSLEPRKNHLLAIQTFLQYQKLSPESVLNLAYSKGWKNMKIIFVIYALKMRGVNIKLHIGKGDQEIQNLYETAKCLLFLSHEEGYGLPIIEGLSMRLPVITLNKKPMIEFKRYGEGLRTVENSVSSLFAQLLWLNDFSNYESVVNNIEIPTRLTSWNSWWVETNQIFDFNMNLGHNQTEA